MNALITTQHDLAKWLSKEEQDKSLWIYLVFAVMTFLSSLACAAGMWYYKSFTAHWHYHDEFKKMRMILLQVSGKGGRSYPSPPMVEHIKTMQESQCQVAWSKWKRHERLLHSLDSPCHKHSWSIVHALHSHPLLYLHERKRENNASLSKLVNYQQSIHPTGVLDKSVHLAGSQSFLLTTGIHLFHDSPDKLENKRTQAQAVLHTTTPDSATADNHHIQAFLPTKRIYMYLTPSQCVLLGYNISSGII